MRQGRQAAPEEPPRVISTLARMRARPGLSLPIAVVALLVLLGVDLVVPGYAIAAAYLVLAISAAVALPRRVALAVDGAGLALTLIVLALQDSMDAPNLLLVCFGILAGAGTFALVSLYESVESLSANVTEHARAEEALRQSEERLRLIVTTATEGIALLDAAGRVTFANDTLARWLGLAPDEVLGCTAEDFLAAEDVAKQDARMDERRAGIGAQYDVRLRARDGTLLWVLVSANPVRDGAGEYAGELLMLTDIGERKESEAALALQAHLLTNVRDAICAMDASARVTYWNRAAEELFGWTQDEALGQTTRWLLKAAIPGSSWDEARLDLLEKGSFRGEVRYVHKDGHEVWADVHTRVIHTEDGEAEGFVTSFRDIGTHKHAQEALAWEAARLRAIVEAAPVGLGIVATDGEVLLRNDVLRDIWAGEAPVRSVSEFEGYRAYWPDTGRLVKPEEWPAARALESGRSFADVVMDIERFDGTRGTIVLSTAPIVDAGAIMGAVTIVQDVTELRQAEQALRFLTDEVRSLHETVMLDASLSSIQLAGSVAAKAGQLLGSDGTSIFLLGEGGSLGRVAGVGTPDPEGVDDLVAQAIGDGAVTVRPLPPPAREAATSPGRVMLAAPLLIRDEILGALAFTFENRRTLSDNQLRIARAFADQAALAIENARLKARIEETAIEAERNRLARDLHDSVTQSLFAASLKAEALPDLLDADRETALGAAEDLRRLSRGALAGMRTMLLEMRADGLAQTPLPELLRHLVEASGGRIGADVRLGVHGQHVLPDDMQTALYRIAQEALNNVARHAKASSVWVDLRVADGSARLEIGDDGRGFDPSAEPAGHFGLTNMRERAEAIGASFTVVAGDGRGTVVVVEWPMAEGEGQHG